MTMTHTYVRCDHPADKVWADITMGAMRDSDGHVSQQIQWCSMCGAFRGVFGNPHDGSALQYEEWQTPELDRIVEDGERR